MADMKVEENRLQTFRLWPVNESILSPERLAKCGFFATEEYPETECAWCHKRIADWLYGDQIWVRHRRLNPYCPFIVNPTNSGNVPTISSPRTPDVEVQESLQLTPQSSLVQQQLTEAEPQFVTMDYKNEKCRLETFRNWPNPNVSPESLAKAGFYYLNDSDKVKCAWCCGVVGQWEPGDNAFDEHKRIFPFCPRVQLGPLIEIASDGIRDLGIQQIKAPKEPTYSSLDSRMRTYARWPRSDIQKPEVLAQAGLYYQNIDDQVRCFHCNGGLRCWQKEDDPWFEHAKWFPKCQFVQLVKGPAYVTEVQQGKHAKNYTTVETMQSDSGQQTVSLDEAMLTVPIQQALQMGLNEGRIRSATKRHIDECGRAYETAEELIEAVLEGQFDEEEESSEQSSSIVREVSRILDTIFNTRNLSSVDSDFDENITPTESPNASAPPHTTNPYEFSSPITEMNPSCSVPDRNSLVNSNGANASAPNIHQDGWTGAPEPINCSSLSNLATGSSFVAPNLKRQLSLEEENRKLKDARLCKVCMDDDVGVVFLPCGHLVTCVQCAPGVSMCPLCRSPIKGFVRTFLS